MRRKHEAKPDSAEKTVRDIRRATRRSHAAEEKIRIVLEGLRSEESVATLCRREGIAQSLYYKWSKEFLEAGKKRLAGDIEDGGWLSAPTSGRRRHFGGAPSQPQPFGNRRLDTRPARAQACATGHRRRCQQTARTAWAILARGDVYRAPLVA